VPEFVSAEKHRESDEYGVVDCQENFLGGFAVVGVFVMHCFYLKGLAFG
jgi:hypothetical protein